jgi:bifunctional oligoribonuclease and PAP phosphatase NrnA
VRDVTVEEVAARLPDERRLLIASHENPDGDALGCVAALSLMAEKLGLAYTAYVPGVSDFGPEYRFLPGLEGVTRGEFPELDEQTSAYILDCASAGRLDLEHLRCAGVCINIDHHQDNTRFGTHNLVVPTAASTTEILYRIFCAAGLIPDREIATALYLGLLTDTGRFQYGNTTPAAHRMAAELQELGVEVNEVYRQVYENVPLPKILLLERALSRLQFRLDGRLAVSWLEAGDFEELQADESYTEGIIDRLRTIEGVKVAALFRERTRNGDREYKASLRSTDGSVNVAEVANLKQGGGHVLAAGFSADGAPLEDLLGWLEQEIGRRL